MDSIVKPIENALAPFFKQLPPLPMDAKRALAKYWPFIAVFLGVAQLVAVLSLWKLGHAASNIVNYANQMSVALGSSLATPELGFFYWLGLAVLFLDGVLLLMAYAPLAARKKQGWDLVFLASLVNVAYGLLLLFDSYYGGFSSLLSSLVGSAIGLYFLFQIRDMYTGKTQTTTGSTSTSAKSQK